MEVEEKNNYENSDELVSDELREFLKRNSTKSDQKYKPELGNIKDPNYNSYKNFLDQIDESIIMKIDLTDTE